MLTNPHDVFRGQSRSPNIVPFHMLGIVSYCATVTLTLRRVVFLIFDVKNVVTLKSGSEVTQGHGSRFTIYGDACPLSCVNAEACLTGWPNA